MYSNKKSGFTLIELLIVVALLGILSTVILVILNPAKQRQRAQDGALLSSMGKAAAALEAYYNAKGKYLPYNKVSDEMLGITADAPDATNFITKFVFNGASIGWDKARYINKTSGTPTAGQIGCLTAHINEDTAPGGTGEARFYVFKPGLQKDVQICEARVGAVAGGALTKDHSLACSAFVASPSPLCVSVGN